MSAKQLRSTPDNFEAFGIAQAYQVDGLVFMSGQIAWTLDGQVVGEGDMGAQATQAMENIGAVLADGDMDMANIVKMTVYVTDMAKSQDAMAAINGFFDAPPPAVTLVQVVALAMPEIMIEIDAIASTTSKREA
jgi:2-iminobutanoate/2-iminopropanoate deaminase